MALDSVAIRESFHLLVLRAIAPPLGLGLRLKGGVNLRAFYGSERYSEDMDLDADPRLQQRLKHLLPEAIRSVSTRRALLELGIRDIEMGNQPAKDTDTVLRYKMGLMAGGVRYPTKIEVSYRGEAPAEWARLASPLVDVTAPYIPAGTSFPAIGYYGRPAALWQKVFALAARTEVQARDVFDLGVLLDSRHDERYGPVDVGFLRAYLTDEILQEAARRALEITSEEFREQVVAFLPPERRSYYAAEWVTTQVAVASFIEAIQQKPLAPDQVPTLPPRRGGGGRQ